MTSDTVSRVAQQTKILELLVAARGGWVPLPDVMRCAAQYNARIYELRHQGYCIRNRTRIVIRIRHSWYRLENITPMSPPPPAKPKPSSVQPSLFQEIEDLQ